MEIAGVEVELDTTMFEEPVKSSVFAPGVLSKNSFVKSYTELQSTSVLISNNPVPKFNVAPRTLILVVGGNRRAGPAQAHPRLPIKPRINHAIRYGDDMGA